MNIEDDVPSADDRGGAVYDSFSDEKQSLHSGGKLLGCAGKLLCSGDGKLLGCVSDSPDAVDSPLPTLRAPKVPLPSRILGWLGR